MFIKNKKGTIVLYLTLIFISIMILITVLIKVSISQGVDGATKSLGRLWGKSIEGEYDLNLLREYGILAFQGMEGEVNAKINRYARETFQSKGYIDYKGARTNLAEYTLGDVNNFQKAIKAANIKPNEKKGQEKKEECSRQIVNKKVTETLPSHQLEGQKLKSKGKAASLNYALTHFNNYTNSSCHSNSYFQNEIEYLICGKKSDKGNLSAIKTKYILERTVANSAYIYTNGKMQSIAMTLAEAMTPGPEAVLTQAFLIETWAYLESKNDWKLIINGKKVPLVKSKESWALDESVLKIKDYNGYVDPGNESGLTYEDYLGVLLLSVKEEDMLLRMMDLIQINMKYNHYEDFSIGEYNTGLEFRLTVNGEVYEFKDQY